MRLADAEAVPQRLIATPLESRGRATDNGPSQGTLD
jgi:hypothetical protein